MITAKPDVTQLLRDLKVRGAQLTVHEGRLRLRSPDGPLPVELKERLRACKAELIQFLSGPVASAPAETIPVAPEDTDLPLSFGQERLWYLDRYEEAGAAYNMPTVLHFQGLLDPRALALSLGDLIQRHAVLRSVYRERDGIPYQLVMTQTRTVVRVVDLRGLKPTLVKAQVDALANQDDASPFDLEQGPICRFHLVRTGNDRYVFLANHHHIAADGWSLGIFFSEWSHCYADRLSGRSHPLQPLPVQYGDFAYWQRHRLKGEAFAAQLTYWQDRLKNLSPLLALPIDRPRPPRQTFHGEVVSFEVPSNIAAGLHNLASQAGTTFFTVGLAAFYVLLARLTRRGDIAIGTPLTARPHTQLEGLIGFFVNTLVLRGQVHEDDHFLSLLDRTKQAVLADFAQSDLPFEHLVEALRPVRDPSYPPLIQVMFSSQSGADDDEWTLPGLRVLPQEAAAPIAKFDLTLGLYDESQRGRMSKVGGAVEYNTDLFDHATIKSFVNAFLRVLAYAVTHPREPLRNLKLATAKPPSGASLERPILVPERLAQQMKINPEALAIATEQEHLNYSGLAQQAAHWAAVIADQGVMPGQVVAVCLLPSPLQLAVLIATWNIGCAYLPLDPDQPAQRQALILEDAEPMLVVTSRSLMTDREAVSPGHLLVEDVAPGPFEKSTVANAPISPETVAYLIYTSGSTGRPKGVAVIHGALAHLVDWHCRAYLISAVDRATHIANPAFDASVWEIWPHLCAGASVHVPPESLRLDPPALIDWLHRERIDIAFLPTPLAEAVLRESIPTSIQLRAMLTGGDQLRQRPPNDLSFAVYNHYGPTEVTVVTTVDRVAASEEEPGLPAIGHAIDHLHAVVLEPNGFLAPQGVPGELHVGGQSLAQGYHRRPALTAARFVPDPFCDRPGARLYRTGDLVRRGSDDRLAFLGRLDHQVQIRGFRVELGEIEAILADAPSVADVVVAVKESRNGSEQLVAYVVMEPDATFTETRLLDHARSLLPHYMVPTQILALERLPVSDNGKLDRDALPVPPDPTPLDGEDQPANICEEKLADIWCQVLELDQVGRHDNFFALGGHSLLAVRLLSHIRQEFGVDLPLAIFSEQPEIAAIASWLQQPRLEHAPSSLVPLREAGSATPLYVVHAFDGQLYGYLSLVRAMSGDRSVYGLAATTNGKDRDVKHLPDLAALYVRDLQKQQPQGPYLLAGWSLGGLIAFEMAQQLMARGQDVADLLLLDSAVIQHERLIDLAALLVQALADRGTPSPLTPNQLRTMPKTRWVPVLTHEFRTAGHSELSQTELADLLSLIDRNISACETYELQPYPGTITYFRAAGQKKGRHAGAAWKKLARGSFRQYKVPGDHFSMVKLPHVATLAKELEEHLDPRTPAKSWWRARFKPNKQT